MLDIDDFKEINDKYGHQVGDSVLIALGEVLINSFRSSDMVFRIGGEEFLVLVHNTDEIESQEIAENLRMDIERLSLIPQHTITVSIGVSEIQPNIEWKEWVKLCDEKLYRAKSNGKNQVVS
jgi:diguanylate cyclase (GGDEF)-like protein